MHWTPAGGRGREVPVHYYMSAPIRTIGPDDSLALAGELLNGYRISSLLVVENGRPLGVVSRTDVIDELVDDLDTPLEVRGGDAPAASRMTRNLIQVDAASPIVAACRTMVETEVHQVVALEAQRPVGMLSRSDSVAAVRDLRLDDPVAASATSITFTVTSDLTIGDVRRLLGRAEIGTALVLDGRFPVGVFGPREQLRARDMPADRPIECAMSNAFLVLPSELPLHRAAAQFVATRAAFVLVTRDGLPAGVLTATDFCRRLARLA
jgi:CBS domain-containing protein